MSYIMNKGRPFPNIETQYQMKALLEKNPFNFVLKVHININLIIEFISSKRPSHFAI